MRAVRQVCVARRAGPIEWDSLPEAVQAQYTFPRPGPARPVCEPGVVGRCTARHAPACGRARRTTVLAAASCAPPPLLGAASCTLPSHCFAAAAGVARCEPPRNSQQPALGLRVGSLPMVRSRLCLAECTPSVTSALPRPPLRRSPKLGGRGGAERASTWRAGVVVVLRWGPAGTPPAEIELQKSEKGRVVWTAKLFSLLRLKASLKSAVRCLQ